MAHRERLLEESRQGLRTSSIKLARHIVVAAVLWLFGLLVFVPLAVSLPPPFENAPFTWAQIIQWIVLISLIIVLIRMVYDLRDTADGLAGIAAVSVSKATTEAEHVESYQKGFRGIIYVLYAAIIYLLLIPFLSPVFPPLAGIVLIILVLWAIIVLFRVGGVFSKAVEDWWGRTFERVGSRLTAQEAGVRLKAEKEEEEEAPSGRRRRGD